MSCTYFCPRVLRVVFPARRKLTLHEAAQVLVKELNYPEEKAYQYAKQFDKNNDGQLSASEITDFTNMIDET